MFTHIRIHIHVRIHVQPSYYILYDNKQFSPWQKKKYRFDKAIFLFVFAFVLDQADFGGAFVNFIADPFTRLFDRIAHFFQSRFIVFSFQTFVAGQIAFDASRCSFEIFLKFFSFFFGLFFQFFSFLVGYFADRTIVVRDILKTEKLSVSIRRFWIKLLD